MGSAIRFDRPSLRSKAVRVTIKLAAALALLARAYYERLNNGD